MTLLKQTFSSPDALLKSQTTTGELSSLDDVTSLVAYLGEGCGTSAQRTQLTLSGCHVTLLPPPPMVPI